MNEFFIVAFNNYYNSARHDVILQDMLSVKKYQLQHIPV